MKIFKTIALASALALSSVIFSPIISTEVHASQRNAADVALKYVGTNPTKMRRLWCANFMGLIERKVGRSGTGSNLARSYSRYGKKKPLAKAKRGDIVVLSRGRRGGHVGYFLKRVGKKVQLVSGNTGGRRGARKVGVSLYSASRVVAVVDPTHASKTKKRSTTKRHVAQSNKKSKNSLKKNAARAIILASN